MAAEPIFLNSFNSFYVDIRPTPVHIQGRNPRSRLTPSRPDPTIIGRDRRMPKTRFSPNQNVIPFPDIETATGPRAERIHSPSNPVMTATVPTSPPGTLARCEIVLSGTYRKDIVALKRTYEEFKDLGCNVLSPTSMSMVRELDGFVYMKGEEAETPQNIEARHLKAIEKANFVWLHAPGGYVGPTAALEVGFANAAGVPVFAQQAPADQALQAMVRLAESPSSVVKKWPQHPEPPAPAIKAFQEYYKRAALQRGYSNEGPKECLLLMVEEVGELARAIRKREKLVRHGSYRDSNEAHELADVFLYVIHMANVLGFDLADVVRNKEFKNVEKFLAK
jgi:NTP pyrophosphatase (non-canonical NTP hydrolase)